MHVQGVGPAYRCFQDRIVCAIATVTSTKVLGPSEARRHRGSQFPKGDPWRLVKRPRDEDGRQDLLRFRPVAVCGYE